MKYIPIVIILLSSQVLAQITLNLGPNPPPNIDPLIGGHVPDVQAFWKGQVEGLFDSCGQPCQRSIVMSVTRIVKVGVPTQARWDTIDADGECAGCPAGETCVKFCVMDFDHFDLVIAGVVLCQLPPCAVGDCESTVRYRAANRNNFPRITIEAAAHRDCTEPSCQAPTASPAVPPPVPTI